MDKFCSEAAGLLDEIDERMGDVQMTSTSPSHRRSAPRHHMTVVDYLTVFNPGLVAYKKAAGRSFKGETKWADACAASYGLEPVLNDAGDSVYHVLVLRVMGHEYMEDEADDDEVTRYEQE